MRATLPAAALAFAVVAAPAAAADEAKRLAVAYAAAVRDVNEDHARSPGKETERDLAKRLPRSALDAFDKLLALPDAPGLAGALSEAAEAALDLDLVDAFGRAAARLAKVDADRAKELGVAVSRPRFLARGQNGLDARYVARVADVFDAVLAAYDDVFGFEEFSKVPGKKLRLRLHLEAKPAAPHFAPEFPYHSEIDFPVTDAGEFRTPTQDGRFLLYGLCHELGHAVAMWGDRGNEEDHHAWAHYTGVTIVERLDETKAAAAKGLGDVRWRSLSIERGKLAKTAPSLADRDGVLATFLALHDAAGPRAIGDAIDALDRKDARLRINRVRYYSFRELRAALLDVVKSPAAKKKVASVLP